MVQIVKRGMLAIAGAVTVVVSTSQVVVAQLDRVYPVTGAAVTGTVANVLADGIVLKTGSNTQNFRVDELVKVTYEGDPPQLTRGRDFFLSGEYQSALDQLRQIDIGKISREYIVADASFYLAAAQAKLALAGQGDRDAAASTLKQFAGKNTRNWHFYEAAELLGDLATAGGDFSGANRFYSAIAKSASPLLQVRANYLIASGSLRQGNAAEASQAFDSVIGSNLDTVAGLRLKTLARAGRAVALARQGQGQQALDEVNALIENLSPADAELAAKIYNARGAANVALNDSMAAILDYLHTHLLFSSVPDAHAEALSQLVKLWPQVNKPEKAAEARQELQTKYPGWDG